MLVANLSKLLTGSRLVSRRPPAPEMCVVVRGTFALASERRAIVADDQGTLTGDVFAPDDDAFAGAPVVPSDFADYKPRTDLLLMGDCHPPGGRAARSCVTTFAVEGWLRSLLVVGERTLLRGGIATEPAPFTRMPLTWANAFGGPAFAANPAGCGAGPQQAGARLPTVGMLTEELRPPEQTRMAASYAPTSPFWTPRWSKIGRNYGAEYQATRAPFYSSDFDWTHFNAAPLEQQLEQRLRGDEWVGFENMHPEHQRFRSQLPCLRVRAIVHMRDGTFGEIPMQLDTLLARPGSLDVVLTWRGVAPVQEEDLSDVVSLLIASEPLEAAPVDDAVYRDALRKLEEAAAFRPDPALIAALRGLPPPGSEQDTRPVAEQLAARLGALGERSRGITAPLGRALDAATAAGSDAAALAGAHLAAATAGATKAAGGGRMPGLSAAASTALADGLATAKAQLEGSELPVAKQTLANPAFAAMLAEMTRPPPDSLRGDLRGADLSRRDLSRLDLTGFDLTGAVLTGARLHGTRLTEACLERADLSGADLTGAILGQARLAGAVLTGAVLDRTILHGADLAGVDLRGGVLHRCLMGGARLAGVNLAGARLLMCALAGADLTGADLAGAMVEQCDLTTARLDGIHAGRSAWTKCVLNKATAAAADFADSVLHGCNGRDLAAPGARFDRCRLVSCGFIHADLTGASFVEAAGERTNFSGATLDGADLLRARLLRTLFTEATIRNASFAQADLTGARFRKALVEDASFLHAKLLRAEFDQTTLTRVRFDEASMFGARFYKVHGAANSYADADFTRAVIQKR